VIHRDVKPSNLLVDGRGNLWVADFGLAQFNTGAGLTRTGELIGTLRYMSPEQAGGKGVPFDHRTDVYSLGATLYELLTLEPIFPGDDYHRLLRHIFNDEPRPLRAIDPSVPAELETIVLKAVSKNAIDRYATAQELADDLKRFVDHRPIRARRPTLIQRLRKWTRRHPSVVPAAVILLIIITAGSLVSAGLIHAEKQKTDQAYQRERQRAEEAEAQFQLARRSVDEMIRTSQEELADSPHLERLRRRLLMSALVYYQELIDGRRDDPAAQEELRETKRSVEKILADLTILEGVGNLHLLSQTAVQDDLELSPEQRLKITDLSDRLMAQGMELFRRFGQLSAEERQTRFLDQARADDAAMNAVLTRSQVSRLRQIALQSQGLAAFRDPVVVDALKLTGEQRKKIRAIESDQFFSSIEGMRPGASPEDFRKSFDQKRLVTLDRVRKLLTPEQEQTWNTLSGKPFQGALPFLFRPGPPGPPPPPPR
jgi:Spy/CpxP family protein refolding chaperone